MKNVRKVQLFRDRLRTLRLSHGFTQQNLAENLGVSLSSVAHWESDSGLPGPARLKKLATILQCSTLYLLGETTERLPATPPAPARPAPANGHWERLPGVTRQVPVVSWAKAGDAEDFADLCNQLDERVQANCQDPNAFALILEGDSMEPKFEAGYRVIFSPNSEPRNGDYVVARLNEGHGVLFKRFRRTGPEGQTIRLESLNPAYAPLEYPATAFRFIYPAVEFRSTLPR